MSSGDQHGKREAQGRLRPGPKPRLTSDAIVERALALLDAEGLDAVSLRRLASELDVTHMALYRYFAAKDDLLEAMVARTLTVPVPETRSVSRWDDQLRKTMIELYTALIRRPGIAELLARRSFPGARFEPMRQQLHDLLHTAGLGERDTRQAVIILTNYLVGAAIIDSSRPRPGARQAFAKGLDLLTESLRRPPEAGLPREEITSS
jgi:AcrR family transcriptional regulator